jgi:hypothetical protein
VRLRCERHHSADWFFRLSAAAMILPGTRINTSGHNCHPIRQMQLARKNWELFGELLSD